MYKFFRGRVENGKLISQVKATDPEFPYTGPQIGDFINLPFDVEFCERELWQIKQRVIHSDEIEFLCERHVWED